LTELLFAFLRPCTRSGQVDVSGYTTDKYRTEDPIALPGVKASERLWGTRPFRTSGDIIILLGVVCAALYIAIFVMIMRL
jgi:hypothetical protein